ncbi:MAG TPA: phosphotransferase [Actinoplanes sp.]|nr:phosphotransferase [Actinoplanes sp.]
MIDAVPPSVVAAAAGAGTVVTGCTVESIGGGSAATTASVERLVFQAGHQAFTVIKKSFRPAAAAQDPGHWAYWRRELLAYESGLLPQGPGLRAPRRLGTDGDAVYLEPAVGAQERPEVAAERLGAWQAGTDVPDVPWLAGHQLAQRIAVTDLDWAAVDADPALPEIWSRRDDLLDALGTVPNVLSHGDFHPGNLVAAGPDTIVLDWGTLGIAPVGADLADLALGTRRDQLPGYVKGAGGRFAIGDVLLGYRVTLALTGVSRVHGMLSTGVPLPADYVRFVKVQAAAIPW